MTEYTPHSTADQLAKAAALHQEIEIPKTAIAQWLQKPLEGLLKQVDRINEWMAPSTAMEEDSPSANQVARAPIVIGGWAMILAFGFFGLWSAIAPLASAAIAPGQVILSGNRKTIQHLEGGIVDEIYVREGQTVKAGEPLVRLNETAARARDDLFRNQYSAALATEARLLAERDNTPEISFPEELQGEQFTEILNSQKRLFESRRSSVEGKEKILEQKKKQLQEEIGGLKSQIASASEQIRLLGQEIKAVRTLLEQGNAQRPRLLALQRQQADLQGQRGEYTAAISRAEQAIAESEIESINLRNEFANQVAAEMKENVDKLGDLRERLKASNDIMDRIIISAPLSGVITDLQVHTIGGVIASGGRLMDIVPLDELLVEAKVLPQDIDVVRVGLEARVQLSAYKARNVPPLQAVVVQVSPDRFDDKRTGMAYYPTRLRISAEELEKHENIELTPGMPADALIVTGERTLLSYLLTPITDSFRKAFREE